MEKSRVMILKAGCDAIHTLGNLKREEDSHVFVVEDDESHFKGNFLDGYGFIDIKFNKEDVRELSDSEYSEYIYKIISIGPHVYPLIFTKRDGNDMDEEEKNQDCFSVRYIRNDDNTIRFPELEDNVLYISKRTIIGKPLIVFYPSFIYAFNSSRLEEITMHNNDTIVYKSKNTCFKFKIINDLQK